MKRSLTLVVLSVMLMMKTTCVQQTQGYVIPPARPPETRPQELQPLRDKLQQQPPPSSSAEEEKENRHLATRTLCPCHHGHTQDCPCLHSHGIHSMGDCDCPHDSYDTPRVSEGLYQEQYERQK